MIDVKDPANVNQVNLKIIYMPTRHLYFLHTVMTPVRILQQMSTSHIINLCIYVNLNAGTSSFEGTVCEANTAVLQSSSYQLLA